MAEASWSKDFAASKTRGASSEKSGGGELLAFWESSSRLATPQEVISAGSSAVLLPESCARKARATAWRPIQVPEPSSDISGPQPPARAVSPRESRPKQME